VFSLGRVIAFGYAGLKKLDDLLNLLREFKVETLIDIRRFPKSKNPDFTRENLEKELPKYRIQYIYMGDILGGFRKGGYQKYMETKNYMKGVIRLKEMADNAEKNQKTVAIMCLEKKTCYCHRRFIIKTLSQMNVEIVNVGS